MCATFRFPHNFVNDAQLFQVFGRDLHGGGSGFRLCRIAPDDGSAPLRRNDGIQAVLHNIDAVTDRNRQGSSGAAFPRYRDDDRYRYSRHFSQVPRNRFTLAAFLRINPRIRARSINQREDRAAELRREMHHAQGFAITFGFRLAKIACQALLRVSAFLMTDDGHGPSVIFPETRYNGLIVSISAVAVQLDKIGKQQPNEVERIRTLWVSGNMRALPRSQVRVKFASQFGNLMTDAFELRISFVVTRQSPQLLDVLFEALEFLLALGPFLALHQRDARIVFSLWAHHATVRTAASPQSCCTASTNSGTVLTRCCACLTAK